MTIRYIAVIIILLKFINLSDKPLVIGQGLIAFTFSIYFVLALSYYQRREKELPKK